MLPSCRRKARENVCERVTIGFGFTSDWMKKWREFFKPIVLRSNVKPITFSTKVKSVGVMAKEMYKQLERFLFECRKVIGFAITTLRD